MNSQQSKILINKHTKSDYETRFLLQSNNHSPNSPKLSSKALQLLGGEEALDFLCTYFAERIADDDVLSKIYSDLNTKTLIHMQKDLLLLALDDNLRQLTKKNMREVCNRLQPHVLIGLMEREEYFDRLENHLADAMIACQIKTKAIFKIQRLFESIRPLLKITRDDIQRQNNHVEESVRFPVLGKIYGKKTAPGVKPP